MIFLWNWASWSFPINEYSVFLFAAFVFGSLRFNSVWRSCNLIGISSVFSSVVLSLNYDFLKLDLKKKNVKKLLWRLNSFMHHLTSGWPYWWLGIIVSDGTFYKVSGLSFAFKFLSGKILKIYIFCLNWSVWQRFSELVKCIWACLTG